MRYTNINDTAFQEQITLAQAYVTLVKFVAQLHARGELRTAEVLAFTHLQPNGETSDPAMLSDFLAAVAAAKSQRNAG